jgi:TolB protein
MRTNITRREFFSLAATAACAACSLRRARAGDDPQRASRLLFVSQGKRGLIDSDGGALRYLEFDFDVPNQVTWHLNAFFPDGRRVLFMSVERRPDGSDKSFYDYWQAPTHLWTYDLETRKLTELATRDRKAAYYEPQLLLSDDRMLVQVVRGGVAQIYNMNLDGSDARQFTGSGDGFPYGFTRSPDASTVAFQIDTAAGYQIWTAKPDGSQRTRIAARAGHLYFGPFWSPDGQWLAFEDCLFGQDPGHDWSDICICRPDGSDFRQLTEGQSMWFCATYGPPQNGRAGSNLVAWTQDGALLFPRRLPGSKVPWEWQATRSDTDHFNRDYKPELARGGTEICRLDPRTKEVTPLTSSNPPVWNFRASQSRNGRFIAWCRAATGETPALWVMNLDGSNPRELTKGREGRGVDHPSWLPELEFSL